MRPPAGADERRTPTKFEDPALWVGQWLLFTVGRGSIDVVSTVLFPFVVLVMWGYPRLQAAHMQRIVGRQGEYHATVSPARITCRRDHSTLIQKWSVFQGYRETAGHFVLLSRDPNTMCLDVLPKRGVHDDGSPRPPAQHPGPAHNARVTRLKEAGLDEDSRPWTGSSTIFRCGGQAHESGAATTTGVR